MGDLISTQEVKVAVGAGPFRTTDHVGVTTLREDGDTFTMNIHKAIDLRNDGLVEWFDDPAGPTSQPETHPHTLTTDGLKRPGVRGGSGMFTPQNKKANPTQNKAMPDPSREPSVHEPVAPVTTDAVKPPVEGK